MADLSTLSTSFPTDYASAALVNANTPMTLCYGDCIVSSGQLSILCDTTFNNGGKSAENYTWNGTGFYFQTTPAPEGTAATNQFTYYAIFDASSTDDSIRIGFDVDRAPATPTITCIAYATDGTYTDVTGTVSENWSSTNHAWLGWYYTGGTLHYVRSTDGNTWVDMRTLATSSISFITTQSDLGFSIAPNRVGGSSTRALVDNINTGGTTPGTATGPFARPIYGGNTAAVVRASSW